MACVIVKYGMANKVVKIAEQNGILQGTVVYGTYKNNNDLLNLLGLNKMQTEVVLLVCPNSSKAVLDAISNGLPPKDLLIRFAMPLAEFIDHCRDSYYIEEGGAGVYNSILAIVDKGKGELVVDAANKAGARGGTIVSGRGLGIGDTQQIFGIEIVPAKELIILLSRAEKTKEIVASIRKALADGEDVILVHNANNVCGAYG